MFLKYNDTDYIETDRIDSVRILKKPNIALVEPGMREINLNDKTPASYWVKNFVKRFYLYIPVQSTDLLGEVDLYYRHDAIWAIETSGTRTVIRTDQRESFTFSFPNEKLPVEKVMSDIFMLRGKIGLCKENGTYYFDPDEYDYEEESNG